MGNKRQWRLLRVDFSFTEFQRWSLTPFISGRAGGTTRTQTRATAKTSQWRCPHLAGASPPSVSSTGKPDPQPQSSPSHPHISQIRKLGPEPGIFKPWGRNVGIPPLLRQISPKAVKGNAYAVLWKLGPNNKPMLLVTVKLIRTKNAQSSSKEAEAASSASNVKDFWDLTPLLYSRKKKKKTSGSRGGGGGGCTQGWQRVGGGKTRFFFFF